MPHAYTADQLVEQPAIGLFEEQGWLAVSAVEEMFDASGTFGRDTPGEVVLVPRLRAALEKLNPQLPGDASAVDVPTYDRSTMNLAAVQVSMNGRFSAFAENAGFSENPAARTSCSARGVIQSLEELVVPGRILRLFCSFTNSPKEKFAAGVPMTLEGGSVYIAAA